MLKRDASFPVGDQDWSEPAILKLYDAEEETLPSEGTVVILPADRMHSVVYGGEKDRIVAGDNLYIL